MTNADLSPVSAALLTRFMGWLNTNTDTFDPVMVRILLDHNYPLGFDEVQIQNMVESFLASDIKLD